MFGRKCLVLGLFVFVWLQALCSPTQAAEIVVNTTSDAIIMGDFRCTLREAIEAANSDMPFDACTGGSGIDTILLASDRDHVISIAGTNEDFNQTGDFDIRDDLIIQPMDPEAVVTIDGNQLDRVFDLFDGADLTLSRIEVRGGDVIGFGGGIFSKQSTSQITLLSSSVINNRSSIFGGGIFGEGPVLIRNSVLSGNDSAIGGGVYMSTSQPLTVESSTFSGNNANSDGGNVSALVLHAEQSLFSGSQVQRNGGSLDWRREGSASDISRLVNCTVSNAEAWEDGGGIYFDSPGTLELLNVTVTRNTADSEEADRGDGGGIFVANGTVRVRNSIIANNSDGSDEVGGDEAPDCQGMLISDGHNFFGGIDAVDCVISGDLTGNLMGTVANPLDVDLGSLSQNGGPTRSYEPCPASPVIDAGDPAGCTGPSGVLLTRDQRDHLRPWDSTEEAIEARCDIGAIEFEAPPGTILDDGFESGDTVLWTTTTGLSPLSVFFERVRNLRVVPHGSGSGCDPIPE